MSYAIPRSMSYLRAVGAAVALLLGAGLASPALATRGIATDETLPPTVPACDLGQLSCSVADFVTDGALSSYDPNQGGSSGPVMAGPFADVFVYSDGLVSIGAPLPNTASFIGGLSPTNLGNNYIAVGFADYTPPRVLVDLFPADSGVGSELDVFWTFHGPTGEDIFGLTLQPGTGGTFNATVGYGAFFDSDGWFNATNFGGVSPSCDVTCLGPDGDDGDNVVGVGLLDGALVGSSYPGGPKGDLPGGAVGPNFTYASVSFTVEPNAVTPVPEPDSWTIMILGLFAVFGVARRSSRFNRVVSG